jgi:hypothetical protein
VEQQAAPTPRRGRGIWVLVAVVVVVVLALVGGGLTVAAISLSSEYSPDRTVHDYFVAQSNGNIRAMTANATYVRGDGALSDYFDSDAVVAMMQIKENHEISAVRIRSARTVDSATRELTVQMAWAGKPVTRAFTVRKDPTRVHYLFFDSWRVDIPYQSIVVELPNQAGPLEIDHIGTPAAAGNGTQRSVEVIAGYHQVDMRAPAFMQGFSQYVDATTANVFLQIPGAVSVNAVAAATQDIKDTFNACDAAKYSDCIGHVYTAPNDGNIYYFRDPYYGEIDYRKYVFTLAGDPTADMKLVIESEPNKVSASGSCAYTMTVDDSRKYQYKGTWTATLTWNGNGFDTDLTDDCYAEKA